MVPAGCFSKDQVYLDGILQLLRHRDSIDFPLLTALGKVSDREGANTAPPHPRPPTHSTSARRFVMTSGAGSDCFYLCSELASSA